MRTTVADPTLVACCGLYCGACGDYLAENCGGCRQSERNTGCCVRNCVTGKGIDTCADCRGCEDPSDCCKMKGSAPRVFGLHFPADRPACLEDVHRLGLKAYSQKMAVLAQPLYRQP